VAHVVMPIKLCLNGLVCSGLSPGGAECGRGPQDGGGATDGPSAQLSAGQGGGQPGLQEGKLHPSKPTVGSV